MKKLFLIALGFLSFWYPTTWGTKPVAQPTPEFMETWGGDHGHKHDHDHGHGHGHQFTVSRGTKGTGK